MSLDQAAYPALVALGKATNTPAEWFLRTLYLESRFQTNPAGNPAYAGLSQLDIDTLTRDFHVSAADYRSWPASRQISQVISPWFQNTIRTYLRGKAPRSPGVVYALNIAPGRVLQNGDGPRAIMYSAGEAGYQKNSALDRDRDGAIRIDDFERYLNELAQEPAYMAARTDLERYGRPASGAVVVLSAVSIVGVGALFAYLLKKKRIYAPPVVVARRFAT